MKLGKSYKRTIEMNLRSLLRNPLWQITWKIIEDKNVMEVRRMAGMMLNSRINEIR